mmetsp:Transcript_47740/g.137503  ORF Transcript_47740/g.137503 Transcript_47740/m.137503 type:complete len:251 (-) Transcript_47740:551-1303(-)
MAEPRLLRERSRARTMLPKRSRARTMAEPRLLPQGSRAQTMAEPAAWHSAAERVGLNGHLAARPPLETRRRTRSPCRCPRGQLLHRRSDSPVPLLPLAKDCRPQQGPGRRQREVAAQPCPSRRPAASPRASTTAALSARWASRGPAMAGALREYRPVWGRAASQEFCLRTRRAPRHFSSKPSAGQAEPGPPSSAGACGRASGCPRVCGYAHAPSVAPRLRKKAPHPPRPAWTARSRRRSAAESARRSRAR